MNILNLTSHILNIEIGKECVVLRPSGLECRIHFKYNTFVKATKPKAKEIKINGVFFKEYDNLDEQIFNTHFDFIIVSKLAGFQVAPLIKSTLREDYNITYDYLGVVEISKELGYFKLDKKLKKDLWVFSYMPIINPRDSGG